VRTSDPVPRPSRRHGSCSKTEPMERNLGKPILKRREQILVVDDDADSCELVGLVLREAGYSIDLAKDGSEALAKAARRRPDVVLADVQMPGIDGLELARRLHAADPTLPVVLTTGSCGRSKAR
jgi:CheY-like chemotaxis protein